MSLNVYIPQTPPNSDLMLLTNHLDDGILLYIGEDAPDDYHVLITGRPTKAQLDLSGNLHTLVIPFAGLPAGTRELMRGYPEITVYNLHHNAVATGEMALALLFACARLLVPADREFRQHDWTCRYAPSPQVVLAQKTVLILGYGSIAKSISPALKAMGMNVLGVRRTAADPDQGIYTLDSLHELLPKAQVLLVTLPATDETSGLLGKDEFDLLPDGAIVVNVGRAQVIDQHAFYDTLKSGKLHAGASDVWYHYPDATRADSNTNTPPADAPFHKLDNMIMSPHRAGAFGNTDVEQARYASIARLLNLLGSGASDHHLPTKVDLGRGY